MKEKKSRKAKLILFWMMGDTRSSIFYSERKRLHLVGGEKDDIL